MFIWWSLLFLNPSLRKCNQEKYDRTNHYARKGKLVWVLDGGLTNKHSHRLSCRYWLVYFPRFDKLSTFQSFDFFVLIRLILFDVFTLFIATFKRILAGVRKRGGGKGEKERERGQTEDCMNYSGCVLYIFSPSNYSIVYKYMHPLSALVCKE